MAAGLLLLVAAIVLTGYNLWDQHRAGEAAESVLGELNSAIHDKSTESEEEYRDDNSESTLPLPDEIEIPDYILNPGMEMPVIEIDGHDYIGVLSIPAISVDIPVMSEWSYPNLKIAPCRYYGSVYQGNFVIAAHDYSAHFGGLKKISVGDEVSFVDVSGNTFCFRVAEIEILKPTDIEIMTSSGWPLTLFTCTIGGQNRITVRCDSVG